MKFLVFAGVLRDDRGETDLFELLIAAGVAIAVATAAGYWFSELPLPYGRGFLLHSGPNGPAPQA